MMVHTRSQNKNGFRSVHFRSIFLCQKDISANKKKLFQFYSHFLRALCFPFSLLNIESLEMLRRAFTSNDMNFIK